MTCLSDCKVSRLRKACCQAWKVRTVWNQQLKLKWNPQERFICLPQVTRLARKGGKHHREACKTVFSLVYHQRKLCEITILFSVK